MRFAVENKILLGFIVSVASLALTGWLSYRATTRLTGTLDLVAHTREVIANVEAVLATLTEVESEQRGYLLTGSAKSLSDSKAATGEMEKSLAHLRKLTVDNPTQQRHLDTLEPLVARRLALLEERTAIYQRSGLQAAAEATASGGGKEAMDQVERIIGDMRAEEDRLLLQREQATRRSSDLSLTVITCSSALAIAVGLVAATVIRRDLHLRERAQLKLQARMDQMEAEIFKSSQQVQAANEQLHAANKELEAFSYSVSHDLRAPLRHIDGFVDLLSKHSGNELDDRGQHFLQIIADAARQMGHLIDDLLIFSRMGRAELRHQTVDMNALVHEAVNNLQPELNGRSVTWNIESLPQVQADATMLRQVLVNLLGNAVKYTRPRNPATIEVSYSPDAKDFEFCVRDNGVGFDMRYADKLFGVFQRLHRADEFEGTGIGLANVRRIIARHGGRTWAEGKVDAGSAFFFTLPKSQLNSA